MSTWHTRKWYQQNFGVDPLKLQLPYKEVLNPYYRRSASPMKLWDEQVVLPYRDQRGIEEYARRSERGKKAAATRKKNLVELFSFFKQKDGRVREILEQLWQIHNSIHELHEKKAECREQDGDPELYFEFGIEHCRNCEQWSRTQDRLRDEHEELFSELEEITGMEKQSIQLARRYLREQAGGAAGGNLCMTIATSTTTTTTAAAAEEKENE
ncbi:MAG TPA: hypothetical protein VF172_12215 [Nitrososphaera sp.]